jgi:1-acyl-sn-glycerol-3-phosphate acyltransferase
MISFRLFRVSVHVVQGLMTCAVVFPFSGKARRSHHIQRWSRRLLYICGVDVQLLEALVVDGVDGGDGGDEVDVLHTNGAAVAVAACAACAVAAVAAVSAVSAVSASATVRSPMIVSNHISWLDIFVINTIHPCRFVAKEEIRRWPLLGWMSERAGTVHIARGNRRDVRRIFEHLVSSLHAGDRIAFFPEGTTALQGDLLPFHANLFEAAIDAGVPIQPYALRYVDAAGAYHRAVEYVGDMTSTQSILSVLRSGGIRAELVKLPLIATDGVQRRALAQASRHAMRKALKIDGGAGVADN